ncbi:MULTISPECIES: hypothetical protein [Pseudoalteromonas]|uniref:hypothetical protein n=1 Tax=Pseudoalteromonas TaxID=53246 RepID=UPI000ADB3A6E|nr:MULTISPECIES: hypothetical protein [Pseudoalteromonas]MDK1311436.1 hypothetical protein [Pseudoalteromonas sp. R96]
MQLKLNKKPVKQLSDDQSALPAKATRAVGGAGRAALQKTGGNSRASDCCTMTDN